MITSIIPLPEFAYPGTVIHGLRPGGAYPGDSYEEVDAEIHTAGRSIQIFPDTLNKYKLQFDDYEKNRRYTMVFISPVKLDIMNLRDPFFRDAKIYPIYLREYILDGSAPQLASNLILNLNGINELFLQQFEGVLPVCSVARTLYHIVDRTGCYNPDTMPKYLLDRMIDPNLGTCAPTNVNFAELIAEGNLRDLEPIIHFCTILRGYISNAAEFMFFAQHFGDLQPLIDPNYRWDLTTRMVMDAMTTWGGYFSWIHEKDEECPRYVTACNDDDMDYVLYYSSRFQTMDFRMDCPPIGQPIKSNLFDPVGLASLNKDAEYQHLMQLSGAIRNLVNYNDAFTDNACYAVGSYLEDLTVYNKNNELIAYVDLVWWLLAHGSGLLNERSTLI